MKKPKFLQNINTRKLYYGTNSTVLIAGFITVVILINLILSVLVAKYPLKIDLTKEKLFVLSDETKKIVAGLNVPVDIIYLVTAGNENALVEETISRYETLSDKITSKKVNPVKDPLFTKKYQEGGLEVSEGSVIVESNGRFKSISRYDMYDVEYTQMGAEASGLALEAKLTQAIAYVTMENLPIIYFVEGHGELDVQFLENTLEGQNFSAKSLDLKTQDVPEDAAALFVIGPQRDFAESEIERLDSYLDKGGRAHISIDPGVTLPAFEQYLRELWGIKLQNDIVFETDQRRYFQTPLYLLPQPLEHDYTAIMFEKGLAMLWPETRTLDFNEINGVTVAPLLRSGENALAKDASAEISTDKQPTDREGTFTLAAVLTKKTGADKDAQIFLAGTSQYLGVLDQPNFANSDFFYTATHSLTESGAPAIAIKSKSLRPQILNLNAMQKVVYALLFAFFPPLLVLAIGLGIWLRRRHL